MANTAQITIPRQGQPVDKLWRDVASLAQFVQRQQTQLEAVSRALGIKRRPMDIESGVLCFHIKTIEADHLVCREWNGTTERDTDVLVAKPLQFRTSFTAEVIDTVSHTYTYTSSNERTSNDGTASQVEVCYPRYTVYAAPASGIIPPGTIFAAVVANGSGVTVDDVPVGWVEVLPSRVWARKNVQS
jgi:hypothetical protein